MDPEHRTTNENNNSSPVLSEIYDGVDFEFVEPETPSENRNVVRKRPRLLLSARAKRMLLNVFNFIYQETTILVPNQVPRRRTIVEKVATMLVISKSTINAIVKEYKENTRLEDHIEPTKTKVQLDFATSSAIKRKIRQTLTQDKYATIVKIHRAIQHDENLPHISYATLKRLLSNMKIKLRLRNNQ